MRPQQVTQVLIRWAMDFWVLVHCPTSCSSVLIADTTPSDSTSPRCALPDWAALPWVSAEYSRAVRSQLA